MPINIEFKARLVNRQSCEEQVRRLAESGPEEIRQRDVFFRCAGGRLKLRRLPDGTGHLIHYRRPDQAGPRASEYTIYSTRHPAPLEQMLSEALGVVGEVRKVRHLYRLGQSRVHLDRVAGLGDFLEIEVELGEGQAPAAGDVIAQALMKQLDIREGDLVDRAYIDLIMAAPA